MTSKPFLYIQILFQLKHKAFKPAQINRTAFHVQDLSVLICIMGAVD